MMRADHHAQYTAAYGWCCAERRKASKLLRALVAVLQPKLAVCALTVMGVLTIVDERLELPECCLQVCCCLGGFQLCLQGCNMLLHLPAAEADTKLCCTLDATHAAC